MRRRDDFEHFPTRQRQVWLELVMFNGVSPSVKPWSWERERESRWRCWCVLLCKREREINFLFCIKVERVKWRDFENFQGHFCTFDLNDLVYWFVIFIQVSNFYWSLKHLLDVDLVFRKHHTLSRLGGDSDTHYNFWTKIWTFLGTLESHLLTLPLVQVVIWREMEHGRFFAVCPSLSPRIENFGKNEITFKTSDLV